MTLPMALELSMRQRHWVLHLVLLLSYAVDKLSQDCVVLYLILNCVSVFAHTSVRLKLQGWRGRSLTTVWPPQVHRLRHNHAQCKKVFWLNKSLPLSLNSMCVITIGAAVVD